MNIGIFSGSFNPIHIGHLMLANYIVEFTEIDEVWFLVSPHNPLKDDAELLDENERFRMVKLALEKYPKLKASDFEFQMPRPSYTINTLEALTQTYADDEFTLIIGADNWRDFEKWKDYDRIAKEYKIKVYPRLDFRVSIPSRYKTKVETLDSPIIEVSSTFIRESILLDKNIRAFLPEEVYNYVEENKLYR